MNPKLGVPVVLGGMVITALLYQETWPLWPTSLFMGLCLLVMTVGIAREKRADRRRP